MASSSCSRYPQLNQIQVQNCLLCALRYLKWVGCSDDIAMNVGSGTYSLKCFEILVPNVQKIVAIDKDFSSINVAKWDYPEPKIQYSVANIEDRSTLTEWMGTITKFYSVNCFTYLKDQAAAFKNVYSLLAPGGEAAFRFCLQSFYFDAYNDLVEQTRWKEYLRNSVSVVPESHNKKYDASHYKKILKETGFQVVACRDEDRKYLFESVEACKKDITNNRLVDRIPREQKEEFKQAIFETFIKHSKGSSKHPQLNYKVLVVLVRKLDTA